MLNENEKAYLGDSVYAQFDGSGLILTTENGLECDPGNEIYLEPEVCIALIKYIKSKMRNENQ